MSHSLHSHVLVRNSDSHTNRDLLWQFWKHWPVYRSRHSYAVSPRAYHSVSPSHLFSCCGCEHGLGVVATFDSVKLPLNLMDECGCGLDVTFFLPILQNILAVHVVH